MTSDTTGSRELKVRPAGERVQLTSTAGWIARHNCTGRPCNGTLRWWQWTLHAIVATTLAVAGSLTAAAQSQTTLRPAAAKLSTTTIARAVNRTVLGLYDGSKEETPAATRLHLLLEMPLNHLGYRIVYWDIAQGLPGRDALDGVAAFATFFSQRVPNPPEYLAWAKATVQRGVKAIVLDNVGADGNASDVVAINGLLGTLGLEMVAYYVSDTKQTTIIARDDGIIEFEQRLDPTLLGHAVIRVRPNQGVRRHLALADPQHVWAKAANSTVVATGPNGGFAASGFTARYDTAEQRMRWIVNPFAFLQRALDRALSDS